MASRSLPIQHQLLAMLLVPLQDVRERPSWELARNNAIGNGDCDFIVAIDSMEMRWFMISIQNRNGNPKEAADNWHV